jgi:uncharacterized membrane protein
MICPKCGLEQPDAPECRQCGVIVSKFKAGEVPPRAAVPAKGLIYSRIPAPVVLGFLSLLTALTLIAPLPIPPLMLDFSGAFIVLASLGTGTLGGMMVGVLGGLIGGLIGYMAVWGAPQCLLCIPEVVLTGGLLGLIVGLAGGKRNYSTGRKTIFLLVAIIVVVIVGYIVRAYVYPYVYHNYCDWHGHDDLKRTVCNTFGTSSKWLAKEGIIPNFITQLLPGFIGLALWKIIYRHNPHQKN